jgi:hypothetical protein
MSLEGALEEAYAVRREHHLEPTVAAGAGCRPGRQEVEGAYAVAAFARSTRCSLATVTCSLGTRLSGFVARTSMRRILPSSEPGFWASFWGSTLRSPSPVDR